jgi:hypothetical protein
LCQKATLANLDKGKDRLAAASPKSKAEALEIDIFYDDTRPLEGRNSFTLQLRLVAMTWIIKGLAYLKA